MDAVSSKLLEMGADEGLDSNRLAALSGDVLVKIARHQAIAAEYLPRLFSDDETLTDLKLSGTDCGDIPLTALADGLSTNSKLLRLHLDSNGITDEGAMLLGEALAVNKTLNEISLEDNLIGEEGARALCKAMERNNNLRVFMMSNNVGINEELMTDILRLTQLNSHPGDFKRQLLGLRNKVGVNKVLLGRHEKQKTAGGYNAKVHLNDWCVEQLAQEMAKNETVALLDLSNNCITDEGAESIARMIRSNRTLDRMVLSGNAITPAGAQVIKEAIADNNTIQHIVMYNNLCPDNVLVDLEWTISLNRQPLTLKALVPRMLRDDPNLVHVSLDDHLAERFYDDVSCRIVADCLAKNTNVKSLSITNGKITEVGARFLADLFAVSGTLQFVDLHNNPLGNGGIYIAKSLIVNSSIIKLNMSSTQLNDECGFQFAEALEANKGLSDLDLSNNPLNACGEALSDVALNSNSQLHLNLAHTRIPERILTGIIERQKVSREPGALKLVLPRIVDGDPTLTEVHLCGRDSQYPLKDSSMKLLAESLEQNYSVLKLDLSYNEISFVGMSYLFKALLENRVTLQELDLSYNPVGRSAEFGVLLANVLSSHSTLRVVRIAGVGLENEGATAIIKKMSNSRIYSTRQLDFRGNHEMNALVCFKLRMFINFNCLLPAFKEKMFPFWTTWERDDLRACYDNAVADFSSYTGRDISPFPEEERGEWLEGSGPERTVFDNSIKPSQAIYNETLGLLCDALMWTKGYNTLNFAHNGIDDDGLEHISRLVGADKMLTKVDISGSRVTDKGILNLIANIKKSYRMVTVNISNCPFVSKEVSNDLTTVLLYNKQPKEVKDLLIKLNKNEADANIVDFSNTVTNHLSDHQIMLLCTVLADNTEVHTIDVSHNHLHVEGLRDLVRLAKEKPNIKVIRARNTLIRGGANVGEVVADLIQSSKTIEVIDLSQCDLQEGFVAPVLAAIKHNDSLREVHLRDTGLSLEAIDSIANSISLNTREDLKDMVGELASNASPLTEIISPYAGFNDSNIVELFTALKTNTRVTKVDLSGNYISDFAGVQVVSLLQYNESVSELILADNRLGKRTMKQLLETLKTNKTITSIDFSSNKIPQSAAEEIKDELLKVSNTIIRIDIRNQITGEIDPSVVDYFYSGLELNFQHEIKDAVHRLSCNDINTTEIKVTHGRHNDVGCFHLKHSLADALYLQIIDLSYGEIGDAGVKHLAFGLFVNRTVHTLILSHNRIGDDGCKTISETLQVNPVLKKVDLRGNPFITDVGMNRLQRVLVFSDDLETLLIDDCDGVSKAAKESVEFVAGLNSRHLTVKELLRNDGEKVVTVIDCSNARASGKIFDDHACKILCDALAEDTFVTTLNISGNGLTFESGYALASLLERNSTIQEIDLSRNSISEGIGHIVKALTTNAAVTTLNIGDNGCSPVAVERLHLLLALNQEPMSMKKECLQLMKQDVTHSVCRVSERDANQYGDVLRKAHVISHWSTSENGYNEFEDTDQHISTNRNGGPSSPTSPGSPLKPQGSGGIVSSTRKLQADDESAEIISSLLRTDLIVKHIEMSWNAITDCGLVTLLQLMRRNNTLTRLSLAHNQITDGGLATVCEYIVSAKNIVHVDLSFNKITSSLHKSVTDALIAAPQVISFQLAGNQFTRAQLDSFAFLTSLNADTSPELRRNLTAAFSNDSSLKVLDLSSFVAGGKWVTDNSTSLKQTCFALRYNTTVEKLLLEFNDLGVNEGDLEPLCAMLATNTYLRELSLAHNRLVNINLLTSTLATSNTSLKSLDLRNNKLNLTASKALAAYLKDSDSLEALDVSHNPWGRAAVSLLQAALPMNSGLKSIEVAGEGIPTSVSESVQHATSLNYRDK